MTKLTDMKITAAERKAKEKAYKSLPSSIDGDIYPYDLKVRLNDDALAKLDMAALPKVGKKLRLVALCTVTETAENASTHGGKDRKNRRLELQIEKLALTSEAQSAEEAMDDAIG